MKLLNAALEGAREAGAETELIDVAKLKINFCKGDSSCYKTGKCFQDDEYCRFRDAIVAADGLILSAPNYIDKFPAQPSRLVSNRHSSSSIPSAAPS